MKIALQLIFILLVAFVLELFLPWWCIAVAAFAGGLLFNSKANFLAGFLAIALLWTIKALLIESSAATTLTDRVASIFMLSKPLLFLVMAILGGLVGGFAAMTGSALQRSKRRNYY